MSTTIKNLSNSIAQDGCPAGITDQGVRDQIEAAVAGGGKVKLVDADDGAEFIAEKRGKDLSIEISKTPAV